MRSRLEISATVRTAVRNSLAQRGLLEVVTPVATISPGGEAELEAPSVQLQPLGAKARRLYLRTSPEVWHKRLLAEGSGPIFEIAPCFRDGEGGAWHDLEFEMVEWYRPGARFKDLQDDCLALVQAAFASTGVPGPQDVHHFRVSELFHRYLDLDLDPEEAPSEFARKLEARGLALRQTSDWDELFFVAWLERIEPRLRDLGVVFVEGYPASQSAMARLETDDPRYAARFELFVNGVELANAFDELTDGKEQARRFRSWQDQRRGEGRLPYPEDPEFFAAVDRLPQTVGIALGLDRLTALAAGKQDLSQVKAIHLARLLGAPS